MAVTKGEMSPRIPRRGRYLFVAGPPLSLLYRGAGLAGIAGLAIWGGLEGDGAGSYAIAAIAALLAMRTLSERMYVTPETLKFRNLLQTYRLPWGDVQGLDYDERPFYWAGKGVGARRHRVMVCRKNGRKISIAATQSVRGGLVAQRVFGSPPTEKYLAMLSDYSGMQSTSDDK
jgi:hypothetical protein